MVQVVVEARTEFIKVPSPWPNDIKVPCRNRLQPSNSARKLENINPESSPESSDSIDTDSLVLVMPMKWLN